jgi:hypothetical protein
MSRLLVDCHSTLLVACMSLHVMPARGFCDVWPATKTLLRGAHGLGRHAPATRMARDTCRPGGGAGVGPAGTVPALPGDGHLNRAQHLNQVVGSDHLWHGWDWSTATSTPPPSLSGGGHCRVVRRQGHPSPPHLLPNRSRSRWRYPETSAVPRSMGPPWPHTIRL